MLSSLAAPAIRYCSINANGENAGGGYAIRLAGHTGSDTIRAQHNFWGAGNTTEQKIGLLIFDGNDQYGLAVRGFQDLARREPDPLKADPAGGVKERSWAR